MLLRLEAYTGEARLRERALEILAAWAPHHEQYGVQAAAYAQALLRYLERPDQIVVVGRRDDPEAQRLHAAALTAAAPLRTVQWLDPADSADAQRLTRGGAAGRRRGRGRRLRLPRPHLRAVPRLSADPPSGGIDSPTRCSAAHGGTMITLYQTEWCFYSHRVRQVLTELGLTYTAVNVPAAREDRVELLAVAGQDGVARTRRRRQDLRRLGRDHRVPARHLPGAGRRRGARRARRLARGEAWSRSPPRAALARLRELLEDKGFVDHHAGQGTRDQRATARGVRHRPGDRARRRGQVVRRRPSGAGRDDVPHRRDPDGGRQQRRRLRRPRRTDLALRRARPEQRPGARSRSGCARCSRSCDGRVPGRARPRVIPSGRRAG